MKLKPGQTFAVMSKEELLKITRQQSSELKALHKRVKRLEECRKKMSDVGEKTDADFRFIFERLEKGMREKKEKLFVFGRAVPVNHFRMLNVCIAM